ncbi:GNAT family N-acetyltransferase [Streptomyces rubiginosohelvolus]|uniref:GNAT family N-acetyltransferase n=1 Tax=Streptomyces rubiginosohelvolus TaxID=67362 RepID=UPI0035E2281C
MTTGQQHQPSVRPAAPEDLGDLQALARRTIDACYRGFLGDEAVDRFIGSGASDAHVESHLGQGGVYCLLLDGRIAGLSVLDGPTVDLMMIDPDRHRRGLGRVLLRHAEETLLARCPVIRLETFPDNVGAREFYEACGWVSAGLLEAEGPAKLVYTRSAAAPS